MSVGADRIDVEEIGNTELAEAEFEAAARQFIEEREEGALVLDFVFAEREDRVNHAATQIRVVAQQWIAHDVEIGVSGQAEALGEGCAARLFYVDENLRGVVETHAGIERHHAGSGFLVVGVRLCGPL